MSGHAVRRFVALAAVVVLTGCTAAGAQTDTTPTTTSAPGCEAPVAFSAHPDPDGGGVEFTWVPGTEGDTVRIGIRGFGVASADAAVGRAFRSLAVGAALRWQAQTWCGPEANYSAVVTDELTAHEWIAHLLDKLELADSTADRLDALEAAVANLEAADSTSQGIAHHNFPIALWSHRPAFAVNEGETIRVQWRAGDGSAGQPLTLEMPDIEGVTYSERTLTLEPFTGVRDFGTQLTFGEVDANTTLVIVPRVNYAGVDLSIEGFVVQVLDVPES